MIQSNKQAVNLLWSAGFFLNRIVWLAQRSTPSLEDEGGLGAVLCRVSHSRPIWYDWAYQKHVAAGIALLISETLQAPRPSLTAATRWHAQGGATPQLRNLKFHPNCCFHTDASQWIEITALLQISSSQQSLQFKNSVILSFVRNSVGLLFKYHISEFQSSVWRQKSRGPLKKKHLISIFENAFRSQCQKSKSHFPTHYFSLDGMPTWVPEQIALIKIITVKHWRGQLS